MVYDKSQCKQMYCRSLCQLQERDLLTEDRTLTPRGREVVTRYFCGLDALVVPLHDTMTSQGVIPHPQACEYDRALYTIASILWKDFTPAEKATMESSSRRASLPKPTLPLLAAAYVLQESIRLNLISLQGDAVNLVRTPTDRFTLV